MRRRFLLAFLLVVLIVPVALAQSPAGRSETPVVRPETLEYVRLVNDPRVLEAMLGRVVVLVGAAVKGQLESRLARSLTSREEEGLLTGLRRALQAVATPEAMESLLAEIVERHFTVDEVRDLTAFYRTPIGQKISRLNYTMSEEMATAGEQLFQRRQQDLRRLIEEELRKGPWR